MMVVGNLLTERNVVKLDAESFIHDMLKVTISRKFPIKRRVLISPFNSTIIIVSGVCALTGLLLYNC